MDQHIALQRRAALAWLTVHDDAASTLPMWPAPIEVSVLTVLARTYGPNVLRDSQLAIALDYISQHGAVALVQCVLWGGQPRDVRFAELLADARRDFEILCGTWPEVFMAHAHSALARFM
ncbi:MULTISPECIES: hypothetical protein [unclassified Caballeronia]|uniref:hypothetical protein n=1 Tax=unclassified Caballeronia TaxID=2646786 RepID=UPI002028C20F|nr:MULTISPECIES: hypothetical protein [unclassified Caballeronia]